MLKRVITGVILIPIVLALIIWLPPLYFTAFILIVTYFAFNEFVTMYGIKRYPLFSVAALLLCVLVIYAGEPQYFTLLLSGAFLLVASFALGGKDSTEEKNRVMVLYLTGFFYLAMTLSFFPLLRNYPVNGREWFIFALVIPWLCDSGAYFTGTKFGKRRMAAQISPKKSWEGATGGFLLSLAGGVLYSMIVFDGRYMVFAIVAALLASTFGQIGDLVESLFKRGAGVKDSGNLIPGHGGILDRLDSLLFSVPVVYGLLKCMEYFGPR